MDSTYVICSKDLVIPLHLQHQMVDGAVKRGARFQKVTLASDHVPQISHPREVTDILLKAAGVLWPFSESCSYRYGRATRLSIDALPDRRSSQKIDTSFNRVIQPPPQSTLLIAFSTDTLSSSPVQLKIRMLFLDLIKPTVSRI